MTLVAGQSLVPALDLKREAIVVKALPKTIDTIVTGQAGCAIGKAMGCRKSDIDLTVTVAAGIEIESGDIVSMAIRAGKRLTR